MQTSMNTKTPIQARTSMKALQPFVHLACVAMLGFSATASALDLHQASELAQGNAAYSFGNVAVTDQHGNRQDSTIRQSGMNNDSLVMQDGVGNRALSVQSGSGHGARILQSGGYLEGSIVQYGQGHEANLLQQGYGKEANIIQGGVRGRVDVMQLNASRGTPVEVTQFSRGKAAIQVIQH
ncbi:hypothetical protein KG088_11480 [Halomonas sp. TRM85114]|uniref:hypothetical protein n=1 Tax=Halomonas jincaotanensis TaxID=2810616 RepID=UPI001BD39CE1|nr:hypothetical protein [Halomonas jincaotanensis]MBS9404253.1 hypothetical protein [Halomonas jincaotanensis]